MQRKLLTISFILILAFGITNVQAGALHSENSTSITQEEEIRLRVYPNPTNGRITITGNLNGSTLEVYNVLGDRIIQRKLSSQETQMDISNLPSGVYMFRLTTEDGDSVVKKVIKR